MILLYCIAAAILAYGAAYALFCGKKSGIAAALSVWCLVLIDVGLLILLGWFRIRT